MASTKSSPSGHPTTREQRGLELARERFEEIWPCGEGGYWRVPGSDGETVYLVDVARDSCSCEEHVHSRRPCKHLYAVRAVRSKRALPLRRRLALHRRRRGRRRACRGRAVPPVQRG